MIVFQELNDIDRSLEVVTAEGTVDNDEWKAWKTKSQVFFCSVECPSHHNPGTVSRKATYKQREAEEGIGVLGEVSCRAACAFELLEAEE